MYRSVKEATACWCPFAQSRVLRFADGVHLNATQEHHVVRDSNLPKPDAFCLADKCMAWRWWDNKELGYCGLAGIPPVFHQ